jgi:hypothetical protein
MRFSRPSPAMVIACLSLFIALGGTSLAAVNFARNAGAVDGKSAVASSTLLSHAAGRLVATASAGPDKGRLPSKFLAGVPHTQTFGKSFDVADNAPGAPQPIGLAGTLGTLTATCNDQNNKLGVEDPTTTLSFVNSSGAAINVSRRVGVSAAVIAPIANQTLASLTITGSNTFSYEIQNASLNVLIDGVVRQDGAGSTSASCLVYGTVMQITNG